MSIQIEQVTSQMGECPLTYPLVMDVVYVLPACHSENNVPVVGKDEVRRSRDMHWLRMDRYFTSIEDDNRSISGRNNKTFGRRVLNCSTQMEVPEDNPVGSVHASALSAL